MAWEFDAGTIAPNASVRWACWWDGTVGGFPGHEYKGIQVMQARPDPTHSGGLTVYYDAALHVSDPTLQLEAHALGYTYFVTVTAGSRGAKYTMRGQQVG
jgi:hypothetical protein